MFINFSGHRWRRKSVGMGEHGCYTLAACTVHVQYVCMSTPTSQLIGEHSSSPHWLLGVVDEASWARLGIEHLWRQVGIVATYSVAWRERREGGREGEKWER